MGAFLMSSGYILNVAIKGKYRSEKYEYFLVRDNRQSLPVINREWSPIELAFIADTCPINCYGGALPRNSVTSAAVKMPYSMPT